MHQNGSHVACEALMLMRHINMHRITGTSLTTNRLTAKQTAVQDQYT